MEFSTIIGLIAASMTTSAFVPQAAKTIKTKSTHDLSVITFSLLFFGNAFWLVYGIYLDNLPLILANSITTILCGIILYMKLRSK